jgi:hypothetical protein
MHADKSPVSDYPRNTETSISIIACDEIFDGGSVKKFGVGKRENFGKNSGGKKSLVFLLAVS